ncbi:MAG: hypothetical protein ABIJ21_09125 [Nanoarchaeota archaeon]
MGIEHIITKAKKARETLDTPFIIGGLVGGGMTYALLDLISHYELFVKDHTLEFAFAATSTYMWTKTLRAIHGKRLLKGKSKKKKHTIDDLIGAGASTAAVVAAGLPQDIITRTIKAGKLYLQYLDPAIRMSWNRGKPLSDAQEILLRQDMYSLADGILRMSLSALIIGYTIYKSASFISSLSRHKKNREDFASECQGLFKRLKGKDEYLAHLDAAADKIPRYHIELMREESRQGNFDNAFRHMRVYLAAREAMQTTIYNQLNHWIGLQNLSEAYRRHQKEPKNSAKHLDLAAAYLRVGSADDFASAENTFEQLSKEDERHIDHNLLYALFLSERRDKTDEKTREQWIKTARLVIADPTTEQESIGETKNKVYAKGSDFIRDTIIFKEKDNMHSLEEEIGITAEIRTAIQGHPEFATIEHLTAVPYQDKIVSVMRREEGETLWGKINKGESVNDHICEVVDFLALLHARMDKGDSQEHIYEKTESRLRQLSVPSHILTNILDNYHPIVAALQDSTYVFNKDAHPANWLFSKYGLFCLDNEELDAIPQEVDLANLLEHGKYLTISQKLEVIDKYINSYNSYAKMPIVDRDQFIFRYFHAVIHRTVNISTAWSIEDRKELFSKRVTLIHNALDAVHYIRDHYSEQYQAHTQEYISLENGLSALSQYFSDELK